MILFSYQLLKEKKYHLAYRLLKKEQTDSIRLSMSFLSIRRHAARKRE